MIVIDGNSYERLLREKIELQDKFDKMQKDLIQDCKPFVSIDGQTINFIFGNVDELSDHLKKGLADMDYKFKDYNRLIALEPKLRQENINLAIVSREYTKSIWYKLYKFFNGSKY